MKRFFRWLMIFFGSLVLLLGIASGVAWHYKPELTAAIHEKIRENINGEFNIDDISVSVFNDFPHVSVTLEGIYLRGLQYGVYKRDFLSAKKVLVNVHLGKLFLREIDVKSIRIEGADVFVFRTKGGYTNLDIFKKDTASAKVTQDTVTQKAPALLNIHTIFLEDVTVAYHDSLKGKAFGLRFVKGRNDVVSTDTSRQFAYKGKIEFDRLQFNAEKGSYLLSRAVEASLNGEFVAAHQRLSIFPSLLKFEKSTVGLTGGFQFSSREEFRLDITSENIDFAEGRSLLPKSLADKLNRYSIDVPFSLRVRVNGKLTPGDDPRIDVSFETKDAKIVVDKHEAFHAFAKGLFSNHVDTTKAFNDPNSKLEISSFEGIVYGFPVKAKGAIKNLKDPYLTLDMTLLADSRKLQSELDSTVFRMRGGQVQSSILYSGKLNDLADPVKRMTSGTLAGTAVLKDLQVYWVPRNLLLKNMNASVAFTRQKFEINSFSFFANKSPVSLKGKIDGFVDLFTHPEKKVYVKLQVASANLNTTTFFPETTKTTVVPDKAQKNKAISEMIDKLYKRLEFDLSVNVAQLEHKNFKASDISGSLVLRNNQLLANSLKMKIAGGDVGVSFQLSDLNSPINSLKVEADVSRADIRQFFYGFNNFRQKTISSENLSGKINAKVGLRVTLDDDFNVMMPTLSGTVDLTVRDGKLTSFAPLEKMSNFLFKRRDFSDVQFAEIKSTFGLRGTELTISRMEVESSVMSMFIEGRFSLGDSTDLSIQLPLSNLKRRDKNYTPANVGTDSKVGPSVFLRARPDEKGVMGIAYDPFRKFRKKGR